MAQIVTITGSIPEDFPEAYKDPNILKAARKYIHGVLGLRKQDRVIIKIREARVA